MGSIDENPQISALIQERSFSLQQILPSGITAGYNKPLNLYGYTF